jgi:hypothetical protein
MEARLQPLYNRYSGVCIAITKVMFGELFRRLYGQYNGGDCITRFIEWYFGVHIASLIEWYLDVHIANNVESSGGVYIASIMEGH